MADVLLGHAYSLRLDPKQGEAGQPYAPLGTLYAAAAVRARGHAVGLCDGMLASSGDAWARSLDRHRPAVAVLIEDSFNYLTKMCLGRVREAALAMAAQARERGCRVLVAGSDPTDHPDAYLEAGADAVIIGEGEVTLGEAVDALLASPRGGLEGVAGLALPSGTGPRRTAPRLPLRDADALPRPAWDLVDVEAYRAAWRRRHGLFSMNAVTTRGCPYHCNWCAKPIWGQRYAVRSPEAVADEVAWLRATYAPDHLWFCDDIFGLRAGWVERFADALVARGATMPFKCLSRADLLSEATVRALRRSGCRTVWIGAESGSQRILDAMEKGTTVGQIRVAAARLRAAGIEVGFFVQFGYPGEDWEDIERTMALLRECRPDDIGISVSYPLPGTPFHERVQARLGDKRQWDDSADLDMMFDGTFTTPFYRRLHRVVHAEFRLGRLGQRPSASLRATAGTLWRAARLPFDRAVLRRLAQRRPRTPPLAPVLTREAAARPTPEGA